MTIENRLPYPGLRAFTREESDLFFGRDGCVDAMLDRLAATRFLAVLGASGSGKSSLVRTGLLDALDLGLHPWAGSKWRVVDLHPGGHPMRNLASALLTSRDGQAPDTGSVDLLTEFLRRGPRSVAEWVKGGNLTPGFNLLLLVDQFEELFRYGNYSRQEEAEAFVALLLESIAVKDIKVHVVVTMRSEYLGACALMAGLAEQINAGLYLTPRMTREECREAIEEPAAVIGFDVEPALVNRLLNDLGNFAPWDPGEAVDQAERLARRADQLPLMQHVLNRLWIRAREGSGGERLMLRLSEYDGLGGLSGALNAHGQEVLDTLGPGRAYAVESVFRSLVSGTSAATAVRRPCRISELIEVAGNREDVLAVVEAFRAPDCNFLRTTDAVLSDDVIVDISHESLIRQWSPLREWLANESRSVAAWNHLVTAEERYTRHEGGLLSGLDLQNLAAWWDSIVPTAAWAAKHGGQFEAIRSFMEESRREEAERVAAAKVLEQRERNRLRRFVAGLAAALAIFVALAIWDVLNAKRLRDTSANLEVEKKNLEIEKGNADRERDLKAKETNELSNLLFSDEFSNVVGLEGLKARVMDVLAKYHSTDIRDQYGRGLLMEASGDAQEAIKDYKVAYEKALDQINALPPGQSPSEELKVSFLNGSYRYCWFSMDIGETGDGRQCLESMKKVAGVYNAENASPALLLAYSQFENLQSRVDADLMDNATTERQAQLRKSSFDHRKRAATLATKAAQTVKTLEAMRLEFRFEKNLADSETSEQAKTDSSTACSVADDMVKKNPLDSRAIDAHVECLLDDATGAVSKGVALRSTINSAGKSSGTNTNEAQKEFDLAQDKLQNAMGGIDYLLGMYPSNMELLLDRVEVEIDFADLWSKLSQADKSKQYNLNAEQDFVKAISGKTVLLLNPTKIKNMYLSFTSVDIDDPSKAAQFYKEIADAIGPSHVAFPKAKSLAYVADDSSDKIGIMLSQDSAKQQEALKYVSASINRLNEQGVIRNINKFSEDFDTYCNAYSRRVRVYAALAQIDNMKADLKHMKDVCLPILEKYPWDIYVRDPLVEGVSAAGQAYFDHKRYQEALPELEYASHWVNAKASITLSEMYLQGLGVPSNSKRGRELEDIAPTQHTTQWSIPVTNTDGSSYPFNIYIRDWPSDYPYVGIDDQQKWLSVARSGTISKDVIEAFQKIAKIAKDNKVSFRDLAVYALGLKDTNKDDPKASFDVAESTYKAAHTPANLVSLRTSGNTLYNDRVKHNYPDEATKIEQELIGDAEELTKESPVPASYRVAYDIYVDAGDRASSKEQAASQAAANKDFSRAQEFASHLPQDNAEDLFRKLLVYERLGDAEFDKEHWEAALGWYIKEMDAGKTRFELEMNPDGLKSIRFAVTRLSKTYTKLNDHSKVTAAEHNFANMADTLVAKDHSDAALEEAVRSYAQAATASSAIEDGGAAKKYLAGADEDGKRITTGTADSAYTRYALFEGIGNAQLEANDIAGAKISFHEAAQSLEVYIKFRTATPPQTSASDSGTLASIYGSLSFIETLDGNFPKGQDAAEHALQLDPNAAWIEANLAHAMLLSGKHDEAVKLYMKARKGTINNRSLVEATADDFRTLKKLGYGRPEMDDIIKQMASE